MKHLKYIILVCVAVSTIYSCKIQYGLTQPTSIDADSFQVNSFENTALLVEPGLTRDFKLALEDYVQDQTNYSLVTNNGDLIFEGEITDYRISPTTSTSSNTAAQNRLTISVRVRFINTNDAEDDVEQTFSFFYDYDGTAQLTGTLKTTAHEEIFDRLTQDIVNATLAKW
ncbi:LPS assembly lipoprotein LptE [Neotamlana laminarinivorans]|uniref:LPS assembly lipoprotein LptE n=1 Tax=Neotamlana laminarinivorans TaxID=2883124 RepID=A0A9X1I153_9FLAO|nr:LptE family protein [Tamlana laminarinivorans]MCB4799326.1 LPS assembly lipoprotein LptE [Tamlana laminarinivorans]